MRVKANAKVNLSLRVLRRWPDGLHAIESVFHSIDLADQLTVRATQDANIEVSGIDFADDTVTRAALALRDATDAKQGAAIHVHKQIPVAAGLAGGSADAAATLRALDELWKTRLSERQMCEIGATIGSDVPFCLIGGPAVVTGRGELVMRLPGTSPLALVLGIAKEGLSTADVYRRYDEVGATQILDSRPMIDALAADDPEGVAAHLHNDLERAAFDMRPELARSKEKMVEAGALGALMSGSGPTIFGVCENDAHARGCGTARWDLRQGARDYNPSYGSGDFGSVGCVTWPPMMPRGVKAARGFLVPKV